MAYQNVRVIVVEDQPAPAARLKNLLERQEGFSYIGTASSVREAVLLIAASDPQLVILDIELGDGTAFDILKQLHPFPFQVIFATGFQEYAIKAIKFGAMDYLLKPIDELEFAAALCKVQTPGPGTAQLELMHQHYLQPERTRRMALRSGAILKIVDIDQIMYLESGTDTTFHLHGAGAVPTHKTIKDFEDLLDGTQFVRIHASYLVNIRFVDHYRPPGSIVLQNGIQLPVAARRKDSLVAYLTGKYK
ncbi:response regulator transcription factor [Pseudoflavitalea sp. X16]|uniref:LytR/AlgR family response regulator transcription factor n=1 Tax=Paraflavitalea devenefica TaxID=2716334 RepID=UPI0014210043|nr:LytTR family DNA-binding domain-containing protein [Paraflavitalea devenefica]NII26181.1 response regulator transcription factor [Paraflavitalea devenefica]